MSARNTPDLATLARRAVQVEVALLRTPLVVTDRVAARLGAGQAVHPKVQAGLAVLDAIADRVAGATPPAPTREQPFADTEFETSAAADGPAAGPSAPVAEPVTTAETAAPEHTPVSESTDELVEHVAEELLEEQELTPLAGELAEDDELRRVQAELNAKRLVAEQQERPE